MARVSLHDVVPVGEPVNIGGGQELEAHGVGIADALAIIARFPELKSFTGASVREVKPERLFEVAPRAVAAIIAAGNGLIGDQKAEKAAAKLPIQYQMDFIEAVVRRTMPDGPGPFIARIQTAMAFAKGWQSGVAENATEPLPNSETTSPEQSSG